MGVERRAVAVMAVGAMAITDAPRAQARHAATPLRRAGAGLQTKVSPPGQRPAGEGLAVDRRITNQTPPLPKVTTFSLTRDRVFGESQIATSETFPGSGRHVTRPSGRVSCF